jgi:hypothetical protein
VTTIIEQIELAWHFRTDQPRDSHGHWVHRPGGPMGQSTIERVRRARVKKNEEEARARVLRARGLGPESIREALYAERKDRKLKEDIAAAIRPPQWGQVASDWGKLTTHARENERLGWPSEANAQRREHEEDKFRQAGIAAQAERNAMVPPPWTPTAELRQLQHDNRRAALQTWTVDEQGQIIRGAHPGVHGQGILADLVKRPSVPGQWKFIRSGNREVTEPQVGDMARMSLGAAGNQVGEVMSVGGGHAVIDSGDDGMRYLVDWRNGGRVVRKDPIPGGWQGHEDDWIPPPWINSEDPPSPDPESILGKDLKFRLLKPQPDGVMRWVARDPHPPNGSLAPWVIHTGDGAEFHISDEALAYLEPKSSPPGVVLGPGIKQLIFPGMPEPEQDVGHTSAPVRKLLDEIGNGALDEGESNEPDDPRGQQAQTSIVTLPDGYKVVYKKGQPKSRADREELSYYVSQAIDGGAPPVARVPGTESDLVEGFIPGQTGNRFLQDHEDEYDDAEEALKTSDKGRKIALLDRLISNSDRNIGNWLVDENGDPVPIDHGQAEFDGEDYGGENDDGSYDHWTIDPDEMTPDYVNELRGKLEALEPEFIRLGREDWYEGMIQALGNLPVNMDYTSISGQVLELGWKYNPAEARDEYGRWTKGAGYAVPDPHRLDVKPNKSPVNYPHPQDHPFFRKHPVSPANVVRAYKESTPQEKAQGMRWYADAHLLATKMADGDTRKGAILLSSYSSQVSWPVDMFNAARAAEENRALGPGDGMISGDMQANAQEALDGASVDEALQAPKTLAFARLIEHGGDEPGDTLGQVVIDRHALSVAMGERLPDKTQVPIGKARYHEYVADQYREAARQLNAEGIKIAPHQLQAVTWIHQLTANQAVTAVQAADVSSEEYARAKGRTTMLRNAWKTWMRYAKEEGLPLIPGTTSLAQVVSDWHAAVAEAVELAAWEHELRGDHGRWAKGPVFYHGSLHQFQPGDVISQGHGFHFQQTDPRFIYLTTKPVTAHSYAGAGVTPHGHVYEVEPTGEYADDINSKPESQAYRTQKPLHVVREIPLEQAAAMPPSPVVPHSPLYIGQDNIPAISEKQVEEQEGDTYFSYDPFTRQYTMPRNVNPDVAEAFLGMTIEQAYRKGILRSLDPAVNRKYNVPSRYGLANLVTAQLELAAWEHEKRDTRGRWTQYGGVGRAAETAEKNREGFSVSVRTGEAPPSGYMVAQTDHTHVFPASILDDHARLTRAIDDMIMAEKSAFAGKQAYLGGWVHDGKLWLEPSDNFDNKYEAVAAGKARNQISIFDLQTYDEIQTGGHGGGRITEHANPQDAGQGPGGLRGHARGRAAGSGSRAGHGDSVWDQVLLAWHFNPAEKRDRLGKWARSEGFSSETIANGRMYVRLQGEVAAARDKGWVDIAGNLSVATDAMRRGNADGFVAAAGYVDYAIEIAEDAGHIADAKRYRKYASQLRSMGDAPQVGTAGAAVKDLLSKVCPEISGLYGGGHESWNGQVTVFPQEDNPGVIGELTWAGRMNIEEGAARSIQKVLEDPDAPVKDPASLEVVLHELTHGLIGGGEAKVNKRREELGLPPKSPERYYEHLDAYQELPVAQIEEGFTELGGIQHAPEFFDKIGIGDRPTTIPSGFARRRHLTLNDLARQYQNPSAIEQGAAWGHYGWQTKMAQEWVQQVAKDEGYKDLWAPGQRGYDRARELADEVNREGPAGKVNVMANQVVHAALKNTPEAPLLDDQDALDKVLRSTRAAIKDAWAGEEAARDAHRAAVKTAHSTAHTVRMARLAGDTVEVGAEGIPITWKKAG